MIGKAVYLAAESAVLFVILIFGGWALLSFSTELGPAAQLICAAYVVLCIPVAIIGATIGLAIFRRSNLSEIAVRGFYAPIRPIALVTPAVRAWQSQSASAVGFRQSIDLRYRDPQGRCPIDMIMALSAHLDAQGIAHSNVGGLTVREEGASWRLEPDLDEDRLHGWVESEDKRDRKQIIDGLRHFLQHDMRVVLA